MSHDFTLFLDEDIHTMQYTMRLPSLGRPLKEEVTAELVATCSSFDLLTHFFFRPAILLKNLSKVSSIRAIMSKRF